MQVITVRLVPGMDLKKEVQKLVVDHRINAGILLSIVGSLSKTRLRLAGATQFYESAGKFEILSLSGTLSVNGSHLHLCVADSQGQCIGGHLSEGCIINTTAEIAIGILPQVTFDRVFDPITGFEELTIVKSTS